MQSDGIKAINLNCIQEVIEFCLYEISLQGLEGCKLTELFQLLCNSAQTLCCSSNELNNPNSIKIYNFMSNLVLDQTEPHSDDISLARNFLWKLLVQQKDLEFVETQKKGGTHSKSPSKTKTKPSVIVNDGENRGFCSEYDDRKVISGKVRGSDKLKGCYKAALDEYGANLVLVACQEQRSSVLCTSCKCLDYESLNDLEYCVLEAVAKSRYEGVYTAGEDGLAKRFSLTAKQLHYTLIMLEGHGLIRKQVLKSERQRTIVYLRRYAFRNKTLIENVCDYLARKGIEAEYADSFVNIKRRFAFSSKQFKTLVQSGERSGFFKRFMLSVTVKVKNGGKLVSKVRETRMLKLLESQLALFNKASSGGSNHADDSIEMDDALDGDSELTLSSSIGVEQLNTMPLYSQIMAKIEQSGRDGISLKSLGHLFGLDFYKARRLGTNLQSHPELVTVMKETTGGRAKFQNLVMRRLLKQKPLASEVAQAVQCLSANDSMNVSVDKGVAEFVVVGQIVGDRDSSNHPSLVEEPELVLIKQDNQTTKPIQALMSDRTMARKKIVHSYLEKNKICTKYEIDKEIRKIEAESGLKGCIDSKTTKRMLLALEKENKLTTFTVYLKNVSYMCVRLPEISETDCSYVNYCSTFKRTFDTVDLKIDNKSMDESKETNQADTSQLEANDAPTDKTPESYHNKFQLTRQFITSEVSKLHFSTSNCKAYALVPKFQKAIVLHRFLQYILFFYDGKSQELEPPANTPFPIEPVDFIEDASDTLDCELPPPNKTFQPCDPTSPGCVPWSIYVPPLSRADKLSPVENNCIFIGEIFSHMPLSVFCSLIAMNHYVPSIVRLLRHPQKRHILVKDLPPEMIAPLIFERRYLRRILSILQNLAFLGLVTFVNSPCNTNQAVNRDVQSQMIYVHRQALFLDTSANKARHWNELKALNEYNFTNINKPGEEPTNAEGKSAPIKYEKCLFDFNESADVIEYWRKLLHVSMHTFKFNVQSYLHENKRIRQDHLNKILSKSDLSNVADLWPIEEFGDHMGPGGYSSQLFLNSFKNWVLTSNISSASANANPSGRAIKKEANLYKAPYSELAILFPFGDFLSLASKRPKSRKRKAPKFDVSDSEESAMDDTFTSPRKVKKSNKPNVMKKKLTETSPEAIRTEKRKNFKHLKAKTLLDKARQTFINKSGPKPMATVSTAALDRRAIWQSDEDELILLIKVTSLYFLPKEKCIPFKLISDVMNELVPDKCSDKKVSSFGRRIKILMKSHMNILFVANKLELCKQSRELGAKFVDFKITKNLVNMEQTDLYVSFVSEIRQMFGKKDYSDVRLEDADGDRFELPSTMEEFRRQFVIKNTHTLEKKSGIQKYFQQPTNDYEISCNTLHSAIHSSILINDKNPRLYESFNLFDKYSDQLLTDVISKMSREHKIIAPTKCSELKKKDVTSFSKHIGKAYHVSQRYQYKWINNISSSVFDETCRFKDKLINHKLIQEESHPNSMSINEGMYDCTDNDDVGVTSFLAHTIENSELQLQIDVPNKIWVSKLI